MNWERLGKEFQLIGQIAQKAGSLKPADKRVQIVQAIGDDTAILQLNSPAQLLWTADMLIEGIHFRLDLCDAYRLGWKALAVNLSDIAAMGGTPVGALLSVAIPEERTGDWWDQFMEGFLDCARTYQTPLLGGDTNRSGQITLDVSVLGLAPPLGATQRNQAQPGDHLFVTGALGGSRAGLQRLLAQGLEQANAQDLEAVETHLKPLPRLEEGHIAAQSGVNAMMDISDGLAGDLPKLCAASGLGAVVKTEQIPIHPAVDRWLDAQQERARFALEGGEDYELLIAVSPEQADSFSSRLKAVPITKIGYLTEEPEIWLEEPDGRRFPLQGGWDHFGG